MERAKSYNLLNKICKSVLLIFLFLSIGTIQAQSSGKITGKIVDQDSGEDLFGANVLIIGTSIGAATDYYGEFAIPLVPFGTHIVAVRYIGYQEKTVVVDINEANPVQDLEISLEAEMIEGETVTITAQALGQIGAINQQLNSNTISNVVSADKIKDIPDVNAAESVGRLPGISIKRSGGEGQKVAIRGLSPKYNVMAVNGVRMQSSDPNDRSVDLNMISPTALSGIEVKKALTADMDADAVGGTVNLKMSKAQDEFQQSYSVQGGYAGLANDNKFGVFRGNFSLSNRFFDNKFGVQVTGYYQTYDRSSDNLDASFEWNGNNDDLANYWMKDVQIRDVVTDRERLGASLVLDYELPNGLIMYTGFVSRLNNHSITQQNQFGASSRNWSGYLQDSESSTTVFNNALQGEFDFDIIKMDFSVSHAVTQMRLPNQIYMSMGPYNGGSLLPGWSIPDGSSVQPNDIVYMTPIDFINTVEIETSRQIKWIRSLKRENDVSAFSGMLDFKVPFNFSNYFAGELKFGGKFVMNERDNDETRWSIDAATGINVAAFEDSVRSLWTNFIGYELLDADGNGMVIGEGTRAQLFEDLGYDVGDFLSDLDVKDGIFTNLLDVSKTHDLEYFLRNHTITANNPTGSGTVTNPMYQEDPRESFEKDYNYKRNFSAFYLMATLNIGKYFTFIPGIRYEKYNYDYTAYNIDVFSYAFYPGDQSYYSYEKVNWDSSKADTWFPQIQLKIKPTDWLDIRLASTKSIIYPDYRAVSPYANYNTSGDTPTLYLGNPYIKPAITFNYDISASVYGNHIGLFTAGYFYKKIEDLIVPIEYSTTDASLINNRIELLQSKKSEIHTWTNLKDPSYVKGFELDWQTRFWYLPSFLNGLVFNINYTHIVSETKYPYYYTKRTRDPNSVFPVYIYENIDTTRSGRLIDQPNDILNLTIGYDYKDFSARLSYLYQNDVVEYAHTRYEAYDEHTRPYSRWDFTAYQKLPWVDGLQIFLNINNITNEADLRYRNMDIPEYLSRAEYYGTTAEFGIRFKP